MWGRSYTERELNFLVTYYKQGRSIADLAKSLGRTERGIQHQLRRLYRVKKEGLPIRNHLMWQPGEDAALEAGLQNGLSVEEIALSLNRTIPGVYGRIHTLGCNIYQIHRGSIPVWSVQGVAFLFNVSLNIARRWIDDSELSTSTKRSGRKRQVGDNAVYEFLKYKKAWPDWSPNEITDPLYRIEALAIRASADGHWLTTIDISNLFSVGSFTVNHWIRRGVLPAMVRLKKNYVWSADLEGFIPPCNTYTGQRRTEALHKIWECRRRKEARDAKT